mmetsp:Transcript_16360/g.19618  ORF Transcript_16360/g.19618 Transcript_16360/m.19618 type:complete len:366 (-) Transcript_16360:861-1958(-)
MHGVGPRCEGLSLYAPVGGAARLLAVHHVAGDNEDGERVLGVSIRRGLLELAGEGVKEVSSDLVHPVVVVAVGREVALYLEFGGDAPLVADGRHLGVLDRREGVGGGGEPGHPEGHEALDLAVVQGHLQALVGVLVVHVVNHVHRVDVELREPLDGRPVALHDLLVPQDAAPRPLGDGGEPRPDLRAGDLVHALVDSIQQELGEVAAGPEELHLLADVHRAHAAGDAVVVAEPRSHEIVVLVLDAAHRNGALRAEPLEVLREPLAPEDSEIGLGAWAEIVERLENSIARLCDTGLAFLVKSTNDQCDPLRIAGKEFVVLRGAEVTHKAQLDHEVVDDLLGIALTEHAVRKVFLEILVEKAIYSSK